MVGRAHTLTSFFLSSLNEPHSSDSITSCSSLMWARLWRERQRRSDTPLQQLMSAYIYLYMYMYYAHVYMYMYMYMYTQLLANGSHSNVMYMYMYFQFLYHHSLVCHTFIPPYTHSAYCTFIPIPYHSIPSTRTLYMTGVN